MIQGPWFITRAALEDYGRLTGRPIAPRSELEQEIARAHLVRSNADGSELWRGGKPLRLRFTVRLGQGVGGDAPQLVRVEGDSDRRSIERARQVHLWDGSENITLEVTDEVIDSGPERRVAYRLSDGTWYDAFRGRQRPNHVEHPRKLHNPPEWVRLQRGQQPRRGKR